MSKRFFLVLVVVLALVLLLITSCGFGEAINQDEVIAAKARSEQMDAQTEAIREETRHTEAMNRVEEQERQEIAAVNSEQAQERARNLTLAIKVSGGLLLLFFGVSLICFLGLRVTGSLTSTRPMMSKTGLVAGLDPPIIAVWLYTVANTARLAFTGSPLVLPDGHPWLPRYAPPELALTQSAQERFLLHASKAMQPGPGERWVDMFERITGVMQEWSARRTITAYKAVEQLKESDED